MLRSYKNLSLISENLGILYGNGLSIILAIELLGELPLNKHYKESIMNIRDRVSKGDSLCKAFGIYPMLYPMFFTGLIALGERSGELSKVLKSLSNYYSKRRKIQSEITTAMIYPSFLVFIIFVMVIFMIFGLIPSLYSAVKSINSNLPFIIEKLYAFRGMIINNTIPTILYFISYGIMLPIIIRRFLKGKIKITPIILKLKIVKEFYEYLLILNLSIILNSGIEISSSLEHCANNTEQLVLRDELYRVNSEILLGSELSKSLEKNKFISKQSIAIIKIGEAGGSLASIVQKIEEGLEESITSNINKLTMKIQPILTIMSAAMVGAFLLIFVMPVFTMMYK